MENAVKHQGQLVFGLDIGTRSIIGTVGYKNDDGSFVVVAQCGKEHDTRAMLDGQIHDINKVGNTIREVKERLEEKIGKSLKKVCIAAAGRVLKTIQIHSDMEFENDEIITEEQVYALQSKATEEAYQELLTGEDEDVKFYCVGSSVVRYYMNGYTIANLLEHKTKNIGVDLIATFLPDDVVDGLYRAVEISGLEAVSLTLEPIAAIELAIPEKFRLLNIALVDVGAGTSDISITREGSIIAFGMIPKAGDSLTEMIANYCLVDFQAAEKIKQDSGVMDTVTYEDILGLPQTVKSSEIRSLLATTVDEMADAVAKKILELNGDKSVGAVFVVGGGGKIPGYTEALAEKLNLVKERVSLRGKEVMGNIIFEDTEMEQNSLLVTPIGICLDFYKENHNFIYVSFNGTTVKLYNNDQMTVMDAAMQTDFKSSGLFPKSGKELNFSINGKKRFVRGEMGEAALIYVNDELANLHTPVKENDVIRVVESTAGTVGKAQIKDMPEYKSIISVIVNGSRVTLPKFPSVNGEIVTENYEIQENDEILFLDYLTLSQIQKLMDLSLEVGSNAYVNNRIATADTKVYENFEVNWTIGETVFEEEDSYASLAEDDGIRTVKAENDTNSAVNLTETERTAESVPVSEEKTGETQSEESSDSIDSTVKFSNTPVDITVVVNGKPILLKGKSSYVFVDVFNYIDFDLSKPQGDIVTTINGRAAQYMENLFGGEVIEIYWRKK